MTKSIEILVPDIGDYNDVEVIEVLVAEGDEIQVEDSLITIESDKASLEIPATTSGILSNLNVKVGDRVSEHDVIGIVQFQNERPEPEEQQDPTSVKSTPIITSTHVSSNEEAIRVPDIGGYKNAEIIEVLVSVGDSVDEEQSLITLESDKASMEVPSPKSGTIKSLKVSLGDKVSESDVIAVIESSELRVDSKIENALTTPDKEPSNTIPTSIPQPSTSTVTQINSSPTAYIESIDKKMVHASPGVRRYARELGANLSLVSGSGPKRRVLKQDVKAFIKNTLDNSSANYAGATGPAGRGTGIPPIPEIDFSKYGDIDRVELGRIQKLSASNLHRAWLNLPMVTHHDEADISDMEEFRKSLKPETEKRGVRITGLAFHMKALAATLRIFPKFNSSLSIDGQALFLKKYFHIGIAVDTPNGLVVPVIRDVNEKSIFDLAGEMADISSRARAKKLKPDEMQGASMTISSLGGIGGTAFTPIVNAPEVAILGITRAKIQPFWNGSDFIPRLMCPFDLTYDHRVIDGADAARFMLSYCQTISDIRRLVL